MYVIDFDVVAIILSVLSLSVFYYRMAAFDKRALRFMILLWAVLASSVFSAASSLCVNALVSVGPELAGAVTTAFLTIHNSIPMLVCLYIATSCSPRFPSKWPHALFFLPWAIALLLVLTTSMTGLVFYFDAAGRYERGPGFQILYASMFVYSVCAFAFLVSSRVRVPRAKRLSFVFIMVLPYLAIFLHLALPSFMLECFAASLGVLVILLTIQNDRELLDGQTGLYSSHAFMHFIGRRIEDRQDFGILIVHSRDLLGMREIYGIRQFGEIVQGFSSWLSSLVEKNATVCALEDGLFAVISAPDTGDASLGELALAIRERSGSGWDFGIIRTEISVRVGILRCHADTTDIYQIKDRIEQIVNLPELIGNRHIFYDTDLEPSKQIRNAYIAYALKDAIEDGSVHLAFQPVYSVKKQCPVAVEVLVSLSASDGEPAGQGEVFRIAESMGLARGLGEMVMASACRWFVGNDLASKGIGQMHVRLLDSQCVETDWSRSVLEIVDGTRMPGECLCIRITETAVANTGSSLKESMEALRARGIRFVLEDYGTGYTDLGRILEMGFSTIKFDRKIIGDGLASAKGQTLLAGSIALFCRLGYTLATGGIDTSEAADALAWMGFECMQGRQFGSSVSGEELFALLKKA